MSKDPAFLMYSNDFLTGVSDLDMQERGQFITLLCLQHQKGCITPKMMRLQCGGIPSDDVLAKFVIDKNGNYINERIEIERQKRKKHSEKQSANARARWDKHKKFTKNSLIKNQCDGNAMAMPLENENVNEDVNVNVNKDENYKVEIFPTFEDFWNQYDKKVGKPKCKKLWNQIRQTDRESIVDHLDKYIPSTPDKAYRKNPETYLRNKSWEDEVFENNINNKTHGKSKTNYSALKKELGLAAS